MDGLTVGAAAASIGLVGADAPLPRGAGPLVPERSKAGYRLYGLAQLNRLRALCELRHGHGVGIDEIASPPACAASPSFGAKWTRGSPPATTPAPGSTGSSASTSGCSPPEN